MMTYKLLESHIYCILLSISNSKKKWQQKKSLEKHRPPAVTSIWGMAPSPNLHDQLPSVVASCHLCRPARGLPPCRFRCSPRQTKKKRLVLWEYEQTRKKIQQNPGASQQTVNSWWRLLLGHLRRGVELVSTRPLKILKTSHKLRKTPLEPHQGLKKHEHPTRFSNY